MKSSNFKQTTFYTFILMFVVFLFSKNSYSQVSYNANGQTLTFSSSNEYHLRRSGNNTNGRVAGDETLYLNVVTIGGVQIHCVITTVSLTSGTTFDVYDETTYNNFFSPQFSYSNTANQTARFKFQFFSGGTYSSTNRTYTGGTAVILQNLYINSYDIDGNGNSNSQQNVAFSEEVAYTTESNNLVVSNNTPIGFKQFRSQSTVNNNNIYENQNRVRVEYAAVSSFDIIIGGRNGLAYYYFDFSMGAAWTSLLDLHTGLLGVDNSANISGNGIANYTNNSSTNVISTSDLLYFDLQYTASQLSNGSDERLIINGASSGGTLSYNRTSNHNFTFNSNNYRIIYNSSTPTLLRFYKLNGTNTTNMTLAEGLALVNAFQYQNIASSPTGGNRNFDLTFTNTIVTSNVATFTANLIILLPIEIISFEANGSQNNIQLDWSVAQEKNLCHYEIFRSNDGKSFASIGKLNSNNNLYATSNYHFIDNNALNGLNFYKLKLVEKDGKFSWSNLISINMNNISHDIQVSLFPNPVNNFINIKFNQLTSDNFNIKILDFNGKIMHTEEVENLFSNTYSIDLNKLSKGIYTMKITDNNGFIVNNKFIKN
jgi:hypothetical protein